MARAGFVPPSLLAVDAEVQRRSDAKKAGKPVLANVTVRADATTAAAAKAATAAGTSDQGQGDEPLLKALPKRRLTDNPAASASDSALDRLAALDASALGMTEAQTPTSSSRFASEAIASKNLPAGTSVNRTAAAAVHDKQQSSGLWSWGRQADAPGTGSRYA